MNRIQYDNDYWVVELAERLFKPEFANNIISISDEDYEKIMVEPCGYKWRLVNGEFQLQPYDAALVRQIHLEELRYLRRSILQAFDVYKTNVFYGIESDINHSSVLTWYQAVLDLNEEAINNPPQEIARYLS